MPAGADAEVHVGFGQAQLVEEDLRHPRVVVLAGVDDRLLGAEGAEGVDHRGGLDEVRPRPEDVHDGCQHNFPSVHRGRLRSPAVPLKKPVYLAGLAWRQVRDDPRRAARLAVRLAARTYAQLIDDVNGFTLVSASTKDKELDVKQTSNVEAASKVGKLLAQRAKEKGLTSVVFDRAGYLYHGRVKALAEAAREEGLEF